MTVRDIISRVIADYQQGTPSDDNRLRPRRVYNAVLTARATILKGRVEQGREVSEYNYTTLPCVPVTATTAHECGCIPIPGCTFFKADCLLPKTIKVGRYDIEDVTAISGNPGRIWQEPSTSENFEEQNEGRIDFSGTTWKALKAVAYNKYTADNNRFFIRNGQLYLVGKNANIKAVTIRAIFHDSIAAEKDCRLCPNDLDPCESNLDKSFYLEPNLIEKVILLAKKSLFGLNTREDTTANSRDSLTQESK